jgi:hypothetical protein
MAAANGLASPRNRADVGASPGAERRIEMLPLRSLRPAQRNPRTHSKKQIRQIADAMRRFGFINPLIVDDRGQITAGHARAEAAKLLGLRQVPVIRLSHLSETEIRAYLLADNKLAEKAGWDRELLAIELEELQIALPEVGLDIGITGFDPGEIDSIMLDFGEGQANPADEIPDLGGEPVVARNGDLFVLGRHRNPHWGCSRRTFLCTVDAGREGRNGVSRPALQRQD